MDSTEIELRHSGGISNSNPDGDLGGAMSSYAISGTLNNLFKNISPTRALHGYIDFRCFYYINNSTDVLESTSVWIDDQIASGSEITIGFNVKNDVQEVIVTAVDEFNDASLMILQMSDYGPPFTVFAMDDPTAMASHFQTMIRLIPYLAAVTVAASGAWPTVTFTVTFLGEAKSKKQLLLQLIQNDIGSGSSVVINKITDGSPVNTVAPTIAFETVTPPTSVVFNTSVELGALLQQNSFPVWVRRETSANTTPLVGDGFSLGIGGNYF